MVLTFCVLVAILGRVQALQQNGACILLMHPHSGFKKKTIFSSSIASGMAPILDPITGKPMA